mmetsp:Transcript_24167/g.50246  ORF Transcript_24167/g.50246 Transcript_24167/m.50246 type:complete len:81 (-) Transcript_24167:265-507(-)
MDHLERQHYQTQSPLSRRINSLEDARGNTLAQAGLAPSSGRCFGLQIENYHKQHFSKKAILMGSLFHECTMQTSLQLKAC